VTQPSGPKGGEPMPEPVPVPVVEAVAEPELELNQPIANDNVVPFRRKIG